MFSVSGLVYKPGWTFKLAGPLGGYLCVFATTTDSHQQDRTRCTQHQFHIPDHLANEREWWRWVFDCLLLCELHEAGEFFQVGEIRPFMPHHQGDGDPYALVERWEP